MKKIALASVAILGSLFMATAMAKSEPAPGYSAQVYKGVQATLKSMFHPFTDISVINATNRDIFMVVPNSPVDRRIAPGYNGHITNSDPYTYFTTVMLLDPYRSSFYTNTVCHEMILTVRGYPGNYTINEDTELCN